MSTLRHLTPTFSLSTAVSPGTVPLIHITFSYQLRLFSWLPFCYCFLEDCLLYRIFGASLVTLFLSQVLPSGIVPKAVAPSSLSSNWTESPSHQLVRLNWKSLENACRRLFVCLAQGNKATKHSISVIKLDIFLCRFLHNARYTLLLTLPSTSLGCH